jgi:hypothetical protein
LSSSIKSEHAVVYVAVALSLPLLRYALTASLIERLSSMDTRWRSVDSSIIKGQMEIPRSRELKMLVMQGKLGVKI